MIFFPLHRSSFPNESAYGNVSERSQDNIQYLGGSDKVDINNANIQVGACFDHFFGQTKPCWTIGQCQRSTTLY